MTTVASFEDVLKLAQADANFRRDLIANPKETLINQGAQIPEGVEVAVIDQNDNKLHLILPSDNQVDSASWPDDPISKLILRASSDVALRAELLADPKGVIARETGFNIPAEVDVSVVEASPNKTYIVLPKTQAIEEEKELSEQELETVSGGWTPVAVGFAFGVSAYYGCHQQLFNFFRK